LEQNANGVGTTEKLAFPVWKIRERRDELMSLFCVCEKGAALSSGNVGKIY
jgi:hypothetical protein